MLRNTRGHIIIILGAWGRMENRSNTHTDTHTTANRCIWSAATNWLLGITKFILFYFFVSFQVMNYLYFKVVYKCISYFRNMLFLGKQCYRWCWATKPTHNNWITSILGIIALLEQKDKAAEISNSNVQLWEEWQIETMKSIQVIFNELGIKRMIQKWLRTRAQKEVDKLSPPNQKTGCSMERHYYYILG